MEGIQEEGRKGGSLLREKTKIYNWGGRWPTPGKEKVKGKDYSFCLRGGKKERKQRGGFRHTKHEERSKEGGGANPGRKGGEKRSLT